MTDSEIKTQREHEAAMRLLRCEFENLWPNLHQGWINIGSPYDLAWRAFMAGKAEATMRALLAVKGMT